MMNEFNDQLDAAELDPRERWKTTAMIICDRCLLQVPGKLAEEIAKPRLRELGKRLRECLETSRGADGERWLMQFEIELRNVISHERQFGRLRALSAESELDRLREPLRNCGYRPIEVDSLVAMLTRADLPLVEVSVLTIKTSSRTIGRGELIGVLKIHAQTNLTAWNGQFPSDDELRVREEAAAGA